MGKHDTPADKGDGHKPGTDPSKIVKPPSDGGKHGGGNSGKK